MNKKNTNPYGTYSLNKIDAPKKEKDTPRATRISSNGDLRGGKKR